MAAIKVSPHELSSTVSDVRNVVSQLREIIDNVEMNRNQLVTSPALRLPQVLALTGCSRSHLYKLIHEGEFKKPFKVGRSSRWFQCDVDVWLDARRRSSLVQPTIAAGVHHERKH